MADATRQIQHNEEHYVAKMNFRSEKILQSQIDRLNREKFFQVKSLNSQMRNYERKLQKINDRILEVEKLSQNFGQPSQRLPTREHFSKLSSDAIRQRHMATGVGYSYIEQLLGASKPLVNRPLRWGINPSLPSLQQQSSKPITLVTEAAASKTFLTEIKGQPIYLRPREVVLLKKQRPNTLVLPPIAMKSNRREANKQPKSETNELPQDSLSEKASRKFKELKNQNDEIINQDANSQLSPIPENGIEESTQIPSVENKDKTADTEKKADKGDNIVLSSIEGKQIATGTSNTMEKPDIVLETDDPTINKEIHSVSSSSLRGHFTTEYEFPTHGVERFTRSSEMLNIESDDLKTERQHKENKPNSFRYQLHSRRFSL